MNTESDLLSDDDMAEDAREVLELSCCLKDDTEASAEIAVLRSIVLEMEPQQEHLFTTT